MPVIFISPSNFSYSSLRTILDIYKTGHGDENIGVMFSNCLLEIIKLEPIYLDKLEKEDLNERMRLLSEENNLLISSLKELNVFTNTTVILINDLCPD